MEYSRSLRLHSVQDASPLPRGSVFVLKYFYEEPAALEVLSPDEAPDPRRRDTPLGALENLLEAPRFYRGYLAGSDLASGRIGLTALPAAVFVPVMRQAFAAPCWTQVAPDGTLRMGEADVILAAPAQTAVLVASKAAPPADLLRAVATQERRYALAELQVLLNETRAVLFPETAHDGFDWSVFSASPLQAGVVEALRAHPSSDARRFVLPFRRAASEHRFYFEQWQLDELPPWVEEV